MTRKPFPSILCLCLSLLLGLLGVQSVGICPGEGAMAVVLCGQDEVVWLDAQGQPAKSCSHCPDCIAAPALAFSTPAFPDWQPNVGAKALAPVVLRLSYLAPPPQTSARAPPALAQGLL